MPKILIFTSWDSPVTPGTGHLSCFEAFIAGHPHADERHAIPVGELGAPASRGEHGDNLGGFLKCGYPKMENPKQKWTIWGYPLLGHLHFGIPLYFFSKKIWPVRPPVVVKSSTCQAQKHMPHQAWLLTGKANLFMGSFMSSKPVEPQGTCSHPLNMGTEPSTKRMDRKRLLWIISWVPQSVWCSVVKWYFVIFKVSTWHPKVFGSHLYLVAQSGSHRWHDLRWPARLACMDGLFPLLTLSLGSTKLKSGYSSSRMVVWRRKR